MSQLRDLDFHCCCCCFLLLTGRYRKLAADAAKHWRKQSRAGTGAADLFTKLAGRAAKAGQFLDFAGFRQAVVQLPLGCGTLTEGEMRTLFAQASPAVQPKTKKNRQKPATKPYLASPVHSVYRCAIANCSTF